MSTFYNKEIAVLIPCFNEEVTIKKVINDFKTHLPSATIYVYDNNSTDNTAAIAAKEGVVVTKEKRQGKGFVISSMFKDVEADVYVMVDGDDTYPADKVHDLIQPIINDNADMVVGTRMVNFKEQSFRPLHVFGNKIVAKIVNTIFKCNLVDIMSGYRSFNKHFVKNIPIVSRGFEVETQITLQALNYNFIITEVPILYGQRQEGSYSKLNTFSDGILVILKIFNIFKAYRPMYFFSIISSFLFVIGLAIGLLPLKEFIFTGKISHFPSAILASGVMIISVISLSCGIILDTINHRLKELFKLFSLGNHAQSIQPSKTKKSD